MDKKGQGLSLTVIIVAAIALIVLVVLVMIFTGKIGGWGSNVDEASDVGEITELRLTYGDCAPIEADKTVDQIKANIGPCKQITESGACNDNPECIWKG